MLTLFVVDEFSNFRWFCEFCRKYSHQIYTPETEFKLVYSNYKVHVEKLH